MIPPFIDPKTSEVMNLTLGSECKDPWLLPECREKKGNFQAVFPTFPTCPLWYLLNICVHLRVRSSAAVSWIKQLPRPTLQAAVPRGCSGAQGSVPCCRSHCSSRMQVWLQGWGRTVPGHPLVVLHTLQSGTEMPFLLIFVFFLFLFLNLFFLHFSVFPPPPPFFFFSFPLVVWIKGP